MPPEFYRELKLHKRNAVCSILGLIAFIILLGLYLMAWNPVVLGICVFLGAIYAFSQYLNHRAGKDQDLSPWQAQTACRSAADLTALMDGEAISEDCHIAFSTHGKHRIRLLMTRLDRFSAKEAVRLRQNANRKINAKYGIQSEGSFYDISRCVRVNLAVVPTASDALVTWVKRTDHTLSRVEVIVNLALITDTGTLLVPKLRRGHDLRSLNSYEAAVCGVLQRLQVDSTNR